MDTQSSPPLPVAFSVVRKGGKIVEIETASPEIYHFLRLFKLTRSRERSHGSRRRRRRPLPEARRHLLNPCLPY
jgi:hypothetical protein